MYLTFDEYKELSGEIKNEKSFNKIEKKVERDIDVLTFSRIRKEGFDNLSDFEKDIVKECMQELIDFNNENKDYINSYLGSYSINGVSISFGGQNPNIRNINGVSIQSNTYQKLNLTRLTSLIL